MTNPTVNPTDQQKIEQKTTSSYQKSTQKVSRMKKQKNGTCQKRSPDSGKTSARKRNAKARTTNLPSEAILIVQILNLGKKHSQKLRLLKVQSIKVVR